MVGIICRPSLLSLVCSFEFHVTGSGVETVRDTPLFSLKLLLVLLDHDFSSLSGSCKRVSLQNYYRQNIRKIKPDISAGAFGDLASGIKALSVANT
jgi:hypothetical protein